ncbi:uncharacterized protein LOC122013625 [Zingiber officinale]|nr:uncharacterized protein LOC122013625 [Zingiber officinale]
MAKQSDFTQKLLSDLRLRKEKLGYSTSPGQKSTHPPPPPEYQGNSFMLTDRRTREAMINYNSRNSISAEAKEIWLTSKHNKAAVSELTSSDIVPVGRNRNIQNSIDVSMALAFVLSNSGKLHYIAKLGNEFITHSGPIMYREHLLNNMKIHASHYPFLSNLQINEISEGVQKLNRVLETCSGSSHFDKDSIKIGRELLKGAMDLEESLKMLVTLQEASDFMVGSQGKQIRLLKDKGEDESSRNKVNRKNTHSKTRISFDGSIDHFFNANYDTMKQGKRELSPSFIRKGMNTTDYDESSSHASMKIPAHRRSLSSSPVFPSNGCNEDHNTERQTSSTSKGKHSTSNHIQKLDRKQGSGNVRMPSVVAKLMGLEEFPSSKAEGKKVGGKDLACTKQIIIADAEARRKVVSQTLLMPSYEGNKCLDEKLIGDTMDKIHKEIQSTSTSKDYAQKSHSQIFSKTYNPAVQTKEKVGRTEQRSKTIDQDMSPKLEKDLEKSKHKMLSWSRYDIFGKKDKLLKQKMTEGDRSSLASSKMNTLQSHQLIAHMVKPKHAVSENEGKEHESNSNVKVATATKDERRSKRSALKLSKLKVDDATSVAKVRRGGYEEHVKQPKEHLKSSKQEMQNTVNRVSDYRELNRTATNDNSDNMNSLQKNPVIEREKSLPTAKKVDAANVKAYRDKSHRVFLGDNFADIETPSKKIQSSFLNDLEKRWKERTSKNQVHTVSLHETDSKQHHERKPASNLLSVDSPVDTGGDKNTLQDISVEEQHVNDMIKEDSVASQNQKVSLSLDTEPRLSNFEEEEKEGATENKHNNCNYSKWKKQEICEANGPGLLTKDEDLLKRLLVNDQHFLDMAQAFLKITIPGVVLQTSNKACQNEENKVLLDCGYELLRRKGRRGNVRAMEPLYSPGDVNIDALVKGLNNDFESLKFSNESTVSDDNAEFLYLLLKRDIENRKPDINCMWDIGWSSIIAASVQKDEITRDLEKHVLSGLISELARELISTTTKVK